MSILPPPSATPAASAMPRKGWWAQHWKWVVPLLALLLGAILVVALVVFELGIARVTKTSEPYRVGVMAAQRDPRVAAALGAPVKDGIMPSGRISTSGAGNGEAALNVSLYGTRGNGTLYIEAERHAGQWRYTTLQVQPDVGEAIPLLEAAGRNPEADDKDADGMIEARPLPAAHADSATPARDAAKQ